MPRKYESKKKKKMRQKRQRNKTRKNSTTRKSKSMQSKSRISQYTGSLIPNNNDEFDIYNLGNEANISDSHTWMFYNDPGDDNIIIKKLGPSSWLSLDDINQEINATTKAGKLGIGPRVIYSVTGTETVKKRGIFREMDMGYMVLELINGRSIQISDLDNEHIRNEVNRLLSLMHTNDMRHNDLHNGNIMIGNVAGDEERVWIIDHNGNSPKQHDKAHTVNDIVFESY